MRGVVGPTRWSGEPDARGGWRGQSSDLPHLRRRDGRIAKAGAMLQRGKTRHQEIEYRGNEERIDGEALSVVYRHRAGTAEVRVGKNHARGVARRGSAGEEKILWNGADESGAVRFQEMYAEIAQPSVRLAEHREQNSGAMQGAAGRVRLAAGTALAAEGGADERNRQVGGADGIDEAGNGSVPVCPAREIERHSVVVDVGERGGHAGPGRRKDGHRHAEPRHTEGIECILEVVDGGHGAPRNSNETVRPSGSRRITTPRAIASPCSPICGVPPEGGCRPSRGRSASPADPRGPKSVGGDP